MKLSAAILAGGMGTRLRTVVSDRPKVMAMVAGRPFLTHLLDQLIEAGIRRSILCTGYMADLIRSELGDSYREMELVYSVEESPLGTAGALRNASTLLSDDMLLVLNGDSYCHCNFTDFIADQISSRTNAGMVLAKVDDVGRFGAVQLTKESLVKRFIEKGVQTGSGWINAGIYMLPVTVIREILPGTSVSLEREVIPQLVEDGLFGYYCPGPFIDIGIPEEYERAQKFFSDGKKGNP